MTSIRRDVLSKLAMAYNWKPLVSSSNPTGGAPNAVYWPTFVHASIMNSVATAARGPFQSGICFIRWVRGWWGGG